MAATITIGQYTYPDIAMIEDQFDATLNLQERGRFQCDVIDYVGVHFQKGEQVTVTDPNVGTVFFGVINTDKEVPQYPTGWILHSIDCIGPEWFADKRTFTRTYSTSAQAGKIVVDQLSNVLSQEGLAANYAEHEDNTAVKFNQGILNNTQGIVDADGNNWLELAQAGSNITITENTTSTFATGTLTNVQAVNNTLKPITVSGLKFQAHLPLDSSTAVIQLNIWAGSLTLGSSDFLNYSIFISSVSPEIKFTLGLNFTDGSSTISASDQNGYSDYSGTDLANVAKDKWYVRRFSLATYSGKTIQNVYITLRGLKNGSYTAYYQNVYLDSGTVFFGTTATTTQLSPAPITYITGYAPASVILSVIPVINVASSFRISPNYNIDPVKLISNSSVTWVSGGSSATIYVSYDGGITYVQCSNNATLPALPAGSNVAGCTLTLKETFVSGADPEIIPTLSNVQVIINSAPSATKSDVIGQFATQAQWNAGTYTGLTASTGGDLTMGTITSPWLNNSIANQILFYGPANTTTVTQSISSSQCSINIKVTSSNNQVGTARLDWAGIIGTANGISIDFDVSIPNTNNFSSEMHIYYLQTYWYSNGEFPNYQAAAYVFAFQQSGISNNCTLSKGANGPTTSNTSTLAQTTVGSNPTHIKITVSNAGVHNVYLNGSSTPTLTATDTTYTQGQIGVGGFTYSQSSGSGQTANFKFSNAVITPNTTTNGTWLGPQTSISSLGTIDNSVIYWTELNTGSNIAATYVQTSVDGGNSYQACTNGGPIPNLTSGENVSGKSVQIYIWMVNNPGNLPLPIIRQLSWRVLGHYPGSSGTRSTVPLGNDMSMTRTIASGWGNAFDGQSYTQVGTGTTSVANGEATIANTSGDVHMHLGSRTWTDEDGTVRFQLSASTMSAGMELRYNDANNYYRLLASQNSLSIIQCAGGISTTLATTNTTIAINTWYRMRFRIAELSTGTLFGRVWQDGILEPSTWNIIV
jgi:hypothetical protein